MGHSSNFVANSLCPLTKLDSSAAGFFSFCSFSLLLRPDRIFLSWLRHISLMARPEFMKLTFCHCRLLCHRVRNWMLHTHWRGNHKHLSVYVDVCISKLYRLTAEVVTEPCSTRIPVWCIVRTVTLQGNSSQYQTLCYSQNSQSRFLFGVSAGEFQLCSQCIHISRIHILWYVCAYIHTHTPRRDEDSFCRSPYDICYKRIRWVIFVFAHCYLLLAVIQLILCIRYKSFLILTTDPINLWSMFEIVLEGVALGWTHLPKSPGF